MLDTTEIRKGDIVRGRWSRKRYRVIRVNSHKVYVINASLRLFRANKAFWMGADELEVIQ